MSGIVDSKKDILVIGMGNILMQDEGVGVRAIEDLECRYHIPDEIYVMDGGTTGTELLEPMRGIKHLIVADAVSTGAPPGTLVRLADDDVPTFFQTKISNHQLGLSDLLAVLTVTGDAPEHVTIIGMEPFFLENKLGLSPQASAGLPDMVEMLLRELGDIGIELKPRQVPLPGYWANQIDIEETPACA